MRIARYEFEIITKLSHDNNIFLRLTAELAGKYAFIGIYICMCIR